MAYRQFDEHGIEDQGIALSLLLESGTMVALRRRVLVRIPAASLVVSHLAVIHQTAGSHQREVSHQTAVIHRKEFGVHCHHSRRHCKKEGVERHCHQVGWSRQLE